MRIRHLAALFAAPALVAACVQGNVTQESGGAIEPSATWSTRSSDTGGVSVAAAMTPASDTQTTASVRVAGAPAGATYTWHIHYGSCENDVGIIGEPNAYPQLTVGTDGQGESEATLSFTTPERRSGTFFVKVYDSTNAANVVACSALSHRGVRASSFR